MREHHGMVAESDRAPPRCLPATASPQLGLLRLQQTAGNAAVCRLLMQQGRVLARVPTAYGLRSHAIEELFQIYVTVSGAATVGGEDYEAGWIEQNLEQVEAVIRMKLNAKAAAGETDQLQYFVDYVEGLRGDDGRKCWLIRAIDHRLQSTTSSTASDVANALGDAAMLGVGGMGLLIAGGVEGAAVRAARASIRNGTAFIDGLFSGLDRELDLDETPLLAVKLVLCNAALLPGSPGAIQFMAGALVAAGEDLEQTLRELWELDREKVEQIARQLVDLLFLPEGEPVARQIGFELATTETRKIVAAMDSPVLTILWEYGKAVGPIVVEVLLSLLTAGAAAVAARAFRTTALFARLAREVPKIAELIDDLAGAARRAAPGTGHMEPPDAPRRGAPDGRPERAEVQSGELVPDHLGADDRAWEQNELSPQTRRMLRGDEALADFWHDMDPDVRRVLTHCSDVCIPTDATVGQVRRVETLLARLTPEARAGLREFLHIRRNDLDRALDEMAELARTHADPWWPGGPPRDLVEEELRALNPQAPREVPDAEERGQPERRRRVSRPRLLAEYEQTANRKMRGIVRAVLSGQQQTQPRARLAQLEVEMRQLMQAVGTPGRLTTAQEDDAMRILREARIIARDDFKLVQRGVMRHLRQDEELRAIERQLVASGDVQASGSGAIRVRTESPDNSISYESMNLEHATRLSDNPWLYNDPDNISLTDAPQNQRNLEVLRLHGSVWSVEGVDRDDIERFVIRYGLNDENASFAPATR